MCFLEREQALRFNELNSPPTSFPRVCGDGDEEALLHNDYQNLLWAALLGRPAFLLSWMMAFLSAHDLPETVSAAEIVTALAINSEFSLRLA